MATKMNNLYTVLYYTSNREDERFEKRIQERLLSTIGDLPLISISQKPMNFGKNICVGDVGASGFNMLRQVLIGCKEAKTKFIISAEADCLYSPDYFKFIPERDDICYRNTNTYLLGLRRDYFYKKNEGGTWVQVIGRDFYIQRLEYLFEGAPEWSVDEKNFPKERGKGEDIFTADQVEKFETEYPCISIKSGKGMRHYSHSERAPIYDLPYWGNGKDFRRKYL
ncbi:MAG: hypothetical protein A2868_01525 [Candidatus Levybacteria bacterium RIFCSPHIGHO2_01_FULL_40_15b]|nr:MAG: hypothetical protein A2868_01525 [Candidatus Levybacteria bacterium RIFCSPHIGHO2_01_FULL_40_15b]